MTPTAVEVLLAEALRDIVEFVEFREGTDASNDEDVRALESVAYVLNQVADVDRERLIVLLGPRLSFGAGLVETDPDSQDQA